MYDLEFYICDNLKYWHVNGDKFLGFSHCVVSHFHVIATMYRYTGCILSIVVSFVFFLFFFFAVCCTYCYYITIATTRKSLCL